MHYFIYCIFISTMLLKHFDLFLQFDDSLTSDCDFFLGGT